MDTGWPIVFAATPGISVSASIAHGHRTVWYQVVASAIVGDILPTSRQEIDLASEPLARVTAYLSALLEVRSADGDWSALSHSVLASHVEARLRCLNLMVFGHGFPSRAGGATKSHAADDGVYQRCLISIMPALSELDSYGFDIPLVVHQQNTISA